MASRKEFHSSTKRHAGAPTNIESSTTWELLQSLCLNQCWIDMIITALCNSRVIIILLHHVQAPFNSPRSPTILLLFLTVQLPKLTLVMFRPKTNDHNISLFFIPFSFRLTKHDEDQKFHKSNVFPSLHSILHMKARSTCVKLFGQQKFRQKPCSL